CYRCGKTGHRFTDCRAKLRGRCNETGHTAGVYLTAKEEAVLALTSEVGAGVDDDDDSVHTSAFKAEETSECGDVGREMGEGESDWQVRDEAWICDSGASTHMTPSADYMTNYRECNLKLRIADGSTRSIEGYGDIKVVFRSGNGLLVDVLLKDV
ncbi:unnamed protein product, partial [Laminaria digitata]